MVRQFLAALCFVCASMARAGAQAEPTPTPAPTAMPAASTEATPAPKWKFGVTPYIWIPSFNANLTFQHPAIGALAGNNVNLGVHVGPSKYLSKLNSALMLALDAKYNDFGAFTDLMYLNLSSNAATVDTVSGPGGKVEVPINVSTSSRLTATIWTIAGTYTLASGSNANLDFLAGARYAGMTSRLDWNFSGPLDILERSGSAQKNVNLWDPIIGVRGRVGMGNKWFIPYYADYGWGDANSTYQAFIGIGRSGPGTDIILVNRWLYYDMANGPVNLLQTVGPALAFRFKF